MENKEADRAHNCVHIHYKREHKQSHVFLCLSLPLLCPYTQRVCRELKRYVQWADNTVKPEW